MSFRSLSTVEAIAFLRAKVRTKRVHHSMTKKICHWAVCANCGLVGLRGTRTDKADCEVEV